MTARGGTHLANRVAVKADLAALLQRHAWNVGRLPAAVNQGWDGEHEHIAAVMARLYGTAPCAKPALFNAKGSGRDANARWSLMLLPPGSTFCQLDAWTLLSTVRWMDALGLAGSVPAWTTRLTTAL